MKRSEFFSPRSLQNKDFRITQSSSPQQQLRSVQNFNGHPAGYHKQVAFAVEGIRRVEYDATPELSE
jgi:hypothetical protein